MEDIKSDKEMINSMEKSNSSKSNNKDVSVVICTKNSEDTIEEVLKSVVRNNPLEIIVVDADSSDNTRILSKKYVSKILIDPGKGLAIARNIGLKEIKGKYTIFIGSDNVIGSKTIIRLKNYMNKYTYVGIAALTRLKNRNRNYFTHSLDMRWKLRFFEGPREVIGTPYIFKTDILKKYQFDPVMSWSDDSDLGAKLSKDGYKLGYSNVICWEIGFESLKSILYRFRMYGKSDYEYYHKYSYNWKLKRKIRSFLHPFIVEFMEPLIKLKSFKKLYYFPFFFFITFYRYKGYIGFAIRRGTEKSN